MPINKGVDIFTNDKLGYTLLQRAIVDRAVLDHSICNRIVMSNFLFRLIKNNIIFVVFKSNE